MLSVIVTAVIVILVLFAFLIGSNPNLIAGYDGENMSEDEKDRLMTDVRIILIGSAISLIPMLVSEFSELVSLSVATIISVIAPLLLVILVIIKNRLQLF